MKYSIEDEARRFEFRNQEKELKSTTSQIKSAWIIFCEYKVAYWQHYRGNYRYLHPEPGEQLALPILVGFMLAVYLIDLVFAYNITEYQAQSAFHGNTWAITFATFALPLGFVAVEIAVNLLTNAARVEAEKYKNPSKVRTYRAWLAVSIAIALIIPFLFITTGYKGAAKSGNPVFLGLLIGSAIMIGLIHLVTIFAGDSMTVAKQRVVSIWSHNRLKKQMRSSYLALVDMVEFVENIYWDYGRDVHNFNHDRADKYTPVALSPLIRYLIRYINKNYYQTPPGEEPGFDERDDDQHSPKSITA
jgi:hypothetical protein